MPEIEGDIASYSTAKKWLYLLTFLMIISSTISIKFNQNSSIPLIPDESINSMTISLFNIAFCGIFLTRVVIAWPYLSIDFKKKTFNIIDHILSICSFSIGISVFSIHNYYFGTLNLLATILIVSLSLIFFLVCAAFLDVFRVSIFGIKNISRKYERNPSELERLATDFSYVMYFNPNNTKLFKKIKFEVGGNISEGRNKNEYSWRINGNKLELLNKDEELFSRFKFDKTCLCWIHTNELDTKSLRNQYILLYNE